MAEKKIVTINEYIKDLVTKYPGLDITTDRDMTIGLIRIRVVYDIKDHYFDGIDYVSYDCSATNFKSTIQGLVRRAVENGGNKNV